MMQDNEMSAAFMDWIVSHDVPYIERTLAIAQDTIDMLCMGGEI
jgi:hypothetical protein